MLGGKNLKLSGIRFSLNSAASGGAISADTLIGDAAAISLETLLCMFCTFVNHTATSYGGAIQISGNTNIELESSTFTGCRTEGDGACVYASGLPSSPTISNVSWDYRGVGIAW